MEKSTTMYDENKEIVANHLGVRFTHELESMFDMRPDSWQVFSQLVLFDVCHAQSIELWSNPVGARDVVRNGC